VITFQKHRVWNANGAIAIKFLDNLTPRKIVLGLLALFSPCYCIGLVIAFILLRSTAINSPVPTVDVAATVTNTAEALPTLVPSPELPTETTELLPTPTQLVLGATTPFDSSNPSPIPALTSIVLGTATPIGQMPLCADFNGSTNPLILADVPSGTATNARIYCRVITDKYQIGVPSVLARGVLVAVDIFALNGSASVTHFNNPISVCLQGTGAFIYLDANQSPRAPQQLTSFSQNGYQCANVPNAGTVVLTSQ
jgi:hypothetical protein